MKTNFTAGANEMIGEQSWRLRNSYLKLAELNLNIESIIEIIEEINQAENEVDFLYLILNKSLNLIPEADYGRIVINKEESAYFLEKVYRKDDIFINGERFYEGPEQKYSTDIIFKYQKENKKLTINLKVNNDFLGGVILYIEDQSSKVFSLQSVKMVSILEKIASSYLTADRYQKLQEKFNQEIILSLSNLLGLHDKYTAGHNKKVAELSRKLAKSMDLNRAEVKNTYWTGILHDIGKTLIPASILNKKGPLTQKEFSEIKKHPELAYKTLKDSAELKKIAKYILHHHEHWDGSGYPDGLRGEEIPVISQIVSVADAWEAMTSDRSYRKSLKKEEAIKRIINNRGKQFSPLVVDLFLDNIS
ncbi:putative nucleotidyltransferase with HDIG domain [Halanaerobium saccharolyticum]|uniref:Putative nucleotidyltransferase with HDIG domain n=1 Tax=Halanaerobium saccharolyticum TaxID=43595 RepID=A0A4R7Z576_9FIRM|nr:HD-GYP domain-containing protein [Halanaerobium saccharolyticum]RAK09400.1 putative nucleotidyltransferase with HDIG domain [Halanaerobium saccharolyticum]TDW06259.1 putative nucleotidyltransferase with HDIG domain [Halanaerobium saccharolyticum]TDX61053.1 putative nucleotidyltransferase with HDIG domain [Halanaerobium saccharolyticum]